MFGNSDPLKKQLFANRSSFAEMIENKSVGELVDIVHQWEH